MASIRSCRACLVEAATISGRRQARGARPGTSLAMTTTPPSLILSRSIHQTPARHTPQQENAATATMDSIRGAVRTVLGKFTQPYRVYGVTQGMYRLCASQAPYKISAEARKKDELKKTEDGEEIGEGGGNVWHDEFHLLPTFSTWSQVTMLHMYLIAVRLRCFEKEQFQETQKHLVDHFFRDAEERMHVQHAIESGAMRQRYLKDLYQAWRGMMLAYDEGLIKGDAVLASAVWRNLFSAREDVDVRHLAAVVAWMRCGLQNLDRMDDVDVMLDVAAALKRSPVVSELRTVDLPAREMAGVAQQ